VTATQRLHASQPPDNRTQNNFRYREQSKAQDNSININTLACGAKIIRRCHRSQDCTVTNSLGLFDEWASVDPPGPSNDHVCVWSVSTSQAIAISLCTTVLQWPVVSLRAARGVGLRIYDILPLFSTWGAAPDAEEQKDENDEKLI